MCEGVPSDFDRAIPTSDYLEIDEETFVEAMEETFQLEDDLDLEPDALIAISNKNVSLNLMIFKNKVLLLVLHATIPQHNKRPFFCCGNIYTSHSVIVKGD